jgi:hypothetical protein
MENPKPVRPAPRTLPSGASVRPRVIAAIERQIEKYDRALDMLGDPLSEPESAKLKAKLRRLQTA